MDALYYYTARSMQGEFLRGSIQANCESAALASLKTRALFVTSIAPSTAARSTFAAALQIGPVSQKHLVALFRALATLVDAGVPIRRALDVVTEECADARLREALASIACGIENGLSLSEAAARHPREFPALFVAMIRAGEAGGTLDEALHRLAATLERDWSVRKRVAAALTYPVVVACAAVGLIAFLLVSVVPMFRSMYDQMHVALPPITSALITAGTVLRSPGCWLFAALLLLSAAAAAVRLGSRKDGAASIETLLLHVPVFGAIARKAGVARLARTLGTLLHSGVALVPAIEAVTGIVGSAPYRRSLDELRSALAEGSSLSAPLARSGLYEALFVQMIRVGEETGSLDGMLLRIADYYDLDVESALTAIGSLIEPAMIVVLGAAVGFIVSAIFIPLYTLIGNLK